MKKGLRHCLVEEDTHTIAWRQALMKKGLRPVFHDLLLRSAPLETSPDEEGIKTLAASLIRCLMPSLETSPDEEGIKTRVVR